MTDATVAQQEEQLTCNQQASGSTPDGGSTPEWEYAEHSKYKFWVNTGVHAVIVEDGGKFKVFCAGCSCSWSEGWSIQTHDSLEAAKHTAEWLWPMTKLYEESPMYKLFGDV